MGYGRIGRDDRLCRDCKWLAEMVELACNVGRVGNFSGNGSIGRIGRFGGNGGENLKMFV